MAPDESQEVNIREIALYAADPFGFDYSGCSSPGEVRAPCLNQRVQWQTMRRRTGVIAKRML